MATRYVSVADANSMLGTSGEDTLVEAVIIGAEALFDTVAGISGLQERAVTEDHPTEPTNVRPEDAGRVFYLAQPAPKTSAAVTVNGVSLGTHGTDYEISGNRLELAVPVSRPTAFPYRWRIAYTAGFATNAIPEDVKLAVKTIVSAVWQRKAAEGVASFSQDLLTVNFKQASLLDEIGGTSSHFVKAVAAKYSVPMTM